MFLACIPFNGVNVTSLQCFFNRLEFGFLQRTLKVRVPCKEEMGAGWPGDGCRGQFPIKVKIRSHESFAGAHYHLWRGEGGKNLLQ